MHKMSTLQCIGLKKKNHDTFICLFIFNAWMHPGVWPLSIRKFLFLREVDGGKGKMMEMDFLGFY